jgi:hypothetical protein
MTVAPYPGGQEGGLFALRSVRQEGCEVQVMTAEQNCSALGELLGLPVVLLPSPTILNALPLPAGRSHQLRMICGPGSTAAPSPR